MSADWERASLQPGSHPSSVFKPSPVMGTYSTEGGFINSNLVTADEESQEFDDLIFALKTGEYPTNKWASKSIVIPPQAQNSTFLSNICSSSHLYFLLISTKKNVRDA